MTLAAALLALSVPSRAALLAVDAAPRPAFAFAAPAAAAAPSAPAPLAAAALPPAAAPLPALPAPSAAPPAAAPAAASPDFVLVERSGRDGFGHRVLVLDALDARDPAAGTAGHIDVSFHDGAASLDQPLDSWVAPGASGAPAGADLSHVRRYLWFGLAVMPEQRGRGLGILLLDEAVARLRAAGVRTLFVRATESSRGFYEGRFGARVRFVEPEDAGDGETLYRLEIDLR